MASGDTTLLALPQYPEFYRAPSESAAVNRAGSEKGQSHPDRDYRDDKKRNWE